MKTGNLIFTVAAIAVMAATFNACWDKKDAPAPVPVVTISVQLEQTKAVKVGRIFDKLSVEASATEGAKLTYQWYSNTTASNTGGTPIAGATNAEFDIPADLAVGIYYYFCEIGAVGAASSIRTTVATITVEDDDDPRVIIIDKQPEKETFVTDGSIIGYVGVTAHAEPEATISYQWYDNTEDNYEGKVIEGATNASFILPATLGGVGTKHYYYCILKAEGATSVY